MGPAADPVAEASFDVIVVGLGAMGSAPARYLWPGAVAASSASTTMARPEFGSSHGDSRAIREL